MSNTQFLFLLLVHFLWSCQTAPPARDFQVDNSELKEWNRETVDSLKKAMATFPNGTEVSIAVIHDTSTLFRGFKIQSDSLQVADNQDKIFQVGSISKVFTSLMLVKMIEEGQLTLDAPIQQFFEEPLNVKDSILIKQLANHHSGMKRIPASLIWQAFWNSSNPYKKFSPEDLDDYLHHSMKLDHTPGHKYAYSNLGAGVLGHILGKIVNASYEELLQEYVTQPLNMERTSTEPEQWPRLLVDGKNAEGETVPYWELPGMPAAGAIASNAEDMSRFAQYYLRDSSQAKALQLKETRKINDNMSIALGWHILHQVANHPVFWHNGGTGGFRSSMVVDTMEQKALVLLSNVSAGHPNAGKIDKLSFYLLKAM